MLVEAGYNQPINIDPNTLDEFKTVARLMWREKNPLPIMDWLSNYFQVSRPGLRVGAQYDNHYNQSNRTIYIDKLSVVSLLHEFWHHAMHVQDQPNTEPDARRFSVSLYATAFPKLYQKMVEADRLIWA